MLENQTNTSYTPGKRIQHLCKIHNLTQKELASRLNVAPSQISRILNGEIKNISSNILIALSKEFHISVDYILGLEPHITEYHSIPMWLMSTSFQPGECLQTIETLDNDDIKKMAYCEYYYFTGQHDKAVNISELYLNHPDSMLKLSACLIHTFANLSLNRINAAKGGLKSLKESDNCNECLCCSSSSDFATFTTRKNTVTKKLSDRTTSWNALMGLLCIGT